MNIECFKEAFCTSVSSCRGRCDCSVLFYNSDGDYDWEEGELEELKNTPGARDIDCGIAFVVFVGVEYVYQCDCWHDEAEKVMEFIDSHSYGIARYLTFEKKRLQTEADNMPTVKGELCDE